MAPYSLKSCLVVTTLLAGQLFSTATGHSILPRTNHTPEYPYQELGSDAAADFETTGYFINHLCINVANLTTSVDFYSRIFGLRKIFTLHVSEHFSITYMGHSQGGKNSTGYQTASEMNRDKNNAAGLIELLHVDVPDNTLPASIDSPNTFSHVGMVVPDIEAVQVRLDSFPEARVLKRLGEPLTLGSKIAGADGFTPRAVAQLNPKEQEFIESVLAPLNNPLIFVADPDGNLVEIQVQ